MSVEGDTALMTHDGGDAKKDEDTPLDDAPTAPDCLKDDDWPLDAPMNFDDILGSHERSRVTRMGREAGI